MSNQNHPKTGSRITVEAIRSERDIRTIKKLLADKPRDLCIFTLGINTNLRASDLVRITVGQVRHLKPGEHFTIREKKTGKERKVTINNSVYQAIQGLLKTLTEAEDTSPLFQSRKGKNPLCIPYLSNLVKSWCKAINLRGNFGAHSLRKTMGHYHRTVFGTDIPTLMCLFNHSSQKQTLAYLGIQETDIQDAYMREI